MSLERVCGTTEQADRDLNSPNANDGCSSGSEIDIVQDMSQQD